MENLILSEVVIITAWCSILGMGLHRFHCGGVYVNICKGAKGDAQHEPQRRQLAQGRKGVFKGRKFLSEILCARDQDGRQIIFGMSPQQLVGDPSYSGQQTGREGIAAHAAGWSILLQTSQYYVEQIQVV